MFRVKNRLFLVQFMKYFGRLLFCMIGLGFAFSLTAFAQSPENNRSQFEIEAENSRKKWSREAVERSIEFYSQALNQPDSANGGIDSARCLFEIGRLYLILDNNLKAAEFFKDSLTAAQKNQSKGEISKAYS